MCKMLLRVGIIWLASSGILLAGSSPKAATAAIAAAPTLTSPEDGATLNTFGPTLTWSNPGGATQYHLQVIPFNNDGPGIDVHVGSIGIQYKIPAPPAWYGLLPDMSYTWRARVSDASTFVGLDDPSWGPWAERRFRTPAVSSATIISLTPAQGDVVSVLTPTLIWRNTRTDVFYYEVQLSKDPTFTTDPSTATAMVYWSLLHGGVTRPVNSYTVPRDFPVEDNATYYWRVRPRIQGDGAALAWSAIFSFQTRRSATPSLSTGPVTFGLKRADPATCTIEDAAPSFAASPTLTGAFWAFRYAGGGTIVRHHYMEGAEAEGFIASVSLSGPSGCFRWFVGIPEKPNEVFPLAAGRWHVEIWHGGAKLQDASFTVSPAAALAFGPITIGSASSTDFCRLSGVSTTFPRGTTPLHFRFNSVGSGSFTSTLLRETTLVTSRVFEVRGPSGCQLVTAGPEGGYTPGRWRYQVAVGGQVVQSVNFEII